MSDEYEISKPQLKNAIIEAAQEFMDGFDVEHDSDIRFGFNAKAQGGYFEVSFSYHANNMTWIIEDFGACPDFEAQDIVNPSDIGSLTDDQIDNLADTIIGCWDPEWDEDYIES